MNHLSPIRHKQRDFFIADLFDIAPKDDIESMQHPLFALKAGDKRIRKYQRGDVSVEVHPGALGHATILDKDVWIYCTSQLVEAINRGREDINRVVRFTAYDFLKTVNRRTDGRAYQQLSEALKRLKGTVIYTNIKTAGRAEQRGFSLINDYTVVENGEDNRMAAIEIELPRWLYRAIENRNVLTLNPKYFQLRKSIDRRIYELVRKHCGKQPSWRVSLKVLQEKSGSTSVLREFRRAIKSLADSDQLPDYTMTLDANKDMINFYSRKNQGQIKALSDKLRLA